MHLFSNFHAQRDIIYNLYGISYTFSFCYALYYIVLKVCICGRFLEECFYYYSQQVIYAAAKESVIPYNRKSTKSIEPLIL